LKLVETELAFLYDVLYTSNAFLHYYEAKSASIWAFASLIGIFFVGTTVAVVPRARAAPRHASFPAGSTFVDTTVADLVITGVILASLALLQVLQLLRCWTSNWAKVSFARDCSKIFRWVIGKFGWRMRLRASLIKIDWSDKYQYLWQNKLGQHSLMESITVGGIRDCVGRRFSGLLTDDLQCLCCFFWLCIWILAWKVLEVFGLQYIRREV